MKIDDEMLMAYADGELSGAEKAAVEAAIAADPALGEQVARHRALRGTLAGAFAPVLDEALPPGLAAVGGTSNVVDLAGVRQARRRSLILRWGSLAAALAIGVIGGYLATGPRGMVATSGGALVARGALAQALETRLAAQEPSDGASPVRIGLTFRDGSGAFCRSFTAARPGAVSGIACRSGGEWRLRMTVAAAPETGGYRQAGSGAAVAEAVEAMIDGVPLDAAAEAAARDAGWQR
jgi:hypothetical protein